MKDKILNDLGAKKGQELLIKRVEQGRGEFTDKYLENREIWDKVPRTDNKKMMGDLYPSLFLGVTREFGLDFSESESQTFDSRSQEEIIMEELQTKRYEPSARPSDALQAPVEAKPVTTATKEKMAKEMTA